MSNHLAVAAATQTLVELLDDRLKRDFDAAKVVPARPDATATDDADPEVRLFLYRVEPNPSWRNTAVPTRSPTGQLYQRPQIGLNLHYLLTFVGNEAQLAPHRMLGSVVRTLEAVPLLTRARIEATIAEVLAQAPDHPLGLSDLAEQVELVRVSPLPLTVDELSTLWSSFFQAPYRLSVAYEACVVLLTADETPTRALPVRERRILATTVLRPVIGRAVADGPPSSPIRAGTTLLITGNQLRGEEITVVAFGGVEVTPDPQDVSGTRIEVQVPAQVRAGVTGLRVIHRRLMGEPPRPRLAGQSSVFPVVIQPRLLPLAAGAVHDVQTDSETQLRSGGLAVSVEPPVGSRQQVTLLLNAVPGGTGRSFVFEDERRDAEGEPDQTVDLDLPFVAVPAGDYLIRVTVDGAETVLAVDTTPGSPTEGQYVGPAVTVP
ncbi:Pvc16 family protein [Geodermatophilus sp. SYSU D01180]